MAANFNVSSPTPEAATTNTQSTAVKLQPKPLTPVSSDDDSGSPGLSSPPIPDTPALKSAFRSHKGHSLSLNPMNGAATKVPPPAKEELWQSALQGTQFESTFSGKKAEFLLSSGGGSGAQPVSRSKTMNKSLSCADISMMSFEKRMKFYYDKYRSNKALHKMTTETEEQTICTFRPATGAQTGRVSRKALSRSSSECRNFAGFLRSQYQFADACASRAEESARGKFYREMQELSFVPKIDRRSKRLAEKKLTRQDASTGMNKTTVYERLHSVENVGGRRKPVEEPSPVKKKAKPIMLNRSATRLVPNRHKREHQLASPAKTERKFTSRVDAVYAFQRVEKELAEKFDSCSNGSGKLNFEAFCIPI